LCPLTLTYSPEFIDNIYLIGVCSTYPITLNAFLLCNYISDSILEDIAHLASAQLDAMKAQGILTQSKDVATSTLIEQTTGPHYHTAIDDGPITHNITITSSHLEEIPYVNVIVLSHFSLTPIVSPYELVAIPKRQ
jgi:hypothetical protein